MKKSQGRSARRIFVVALFILCIPLHASACEGVGAKAKPGEPATAAGAAGECSAEAKAYFSSLDDSLRAYAREVAKRGDVRSLLTATLIAPKSEPRLAKGQMPFIDEQAQHWFEAARTAGANDAWGAWIDAIDCDYLSTKCNHLEAARHLVQLEPDNGFAHT